MKLATVRVNGIKQKTFTEASLAAAYAKSLTNEVAREKITCKFEEYVYPTCKTNSLFLQQDLNDKDQGIEKYRALPSTYAPYHCYIDISNMGSANYISYSEVTCIGGTTRNKMLLWTTTWNKDIKKECSSAELAAYTMAGKMLASL